MAAPGKGRRMVEALEGDILAGRYRRGERLPSIRELMRIYGLASGTVARGIGHLVDRGLLEKRARSGVYVRAAGAASATVSGTQAHVTLFHTCGRDLAASDSPGRLLGQAIAGIREVAEESNLALSVEYSPSGRFRVAADRFELANRHSDAIIMLGEFDVLHTDLRFSVPAVGVLCDRTYGGCMSLINVDVYDAAEAACDYFESRGTTTVEVLSPTAPVFWRRAERFREAWLERGHVVADVKRMEYAPLELPPDHGHFFASDSMAQYFSELHQKQTGRELAEDRIVFSVDGKGLINQSFHHFPSYAVDWRRLGNMAVHEVLYRLAHPGTPARRISVCGHPGSKATRS